MVYLESKQLGWKPVLESWLNTIPKALVENAKFEVRSTTKFKNTCMYVLPSIFRHALFKWPLGKHIVREVFYRLVLCAVLETRRFLLFIV